MKEEIRDIAENARINVSDEETDQLEKDFEKILSTFESLDSIETENVEPSFHPTEINSKTREDEPEETINNQFRNSENVEEGYFKGPSV